MKCVNKGIMVLVALLFTMFFLLSDSSFCNHAIAQDTSEEATESSQYTVSFDSNVPENASTKERLSGVMDDETFDVNESKQLPENKYNLPGYDFVEWNTKADGSGKGYADQVSVKNLAIGGNSKVTLYAQWTPKAYSIILDSGTAGFPSVTIEGVLFDQATAIKTMSELGWLNSFHQFFGWRDAESLVTLYDDGEEIVNLCRFDESGNICGRKLSAQWIENGRVAAVVTLDYVLCQDLEGELVIRDIDNPETVCGVLNEDSNGIYVYTPPAVGGIEPGKEYTLSFEPSDGHNEFKKSSIDFKYGLDFTVSVIFDYYTVAVNKDSAYEDVHAVSWSSNSQIYSSIPVIKDGERVFLKTATDPGYHLERYSFVGVEPQWNPLIADQSIVICGPVTIQAHISPNSYKVHFDANASDGVSGAMEDLELEYDETTDLPAVQFSRIGAEFVGWNTKKDGSGDSYKDMQSIKNLTDENNAVITLYAQWKINKYKVTFFDEDGKTILKEETEYEYGTSAEDIVKPADPTKDSDNQYTYTFAGWTPEISKVVGDAAYIATYEKKGKLVFEWSDGTPDGEHGQIVFDADLGDKITIPEGPKLEGRTFKYWKGSEYYPGDLYIVVGNHSFVAVWEDPVVPEIPVVPVITEEASAPVETAPVDSTPTTGDNSAVIPWILMILASVMVLATVQRRKIKENQKRQF